MTFHFLRLILLLASVTINMANATDVIRFIESKEHPDPKQSYFIDLLTLALETSKKKYGDYQLLPVNIEMSQGRTSMMLEQNKYIDITWRMTSKNLEDKLHTIYIPLLKGLMGYRIFIICKSKQALFTPKTSVEDLKAIHLGQGISWPDTEILRSNGFDVIEGYDNYLISMLKKERFEYFPRALHEPWFEITDEPSLKVEEHLLLKYPAPIYFFVNKKNNRLQQRLEFGLTQLVDSGEFEQFFLNHPITSDILAKAQVSSRTVFQLDNPLLSTQTKALLADKRLWINVK